MTKALSPEIKLDLTTAWLAVGTKPAWRASAGQHEIHVHFI